MIREEDIFTIGRVTKFRGIRGEVEIDFTDDIFDRVECPYLLLDIDGLPVPFFWDEYKFKNDHTVIVKFEDVENETEATKLVGRAVMFEKRFLEDFADDDEIVLSRLIGYHIYNKECEVGKITDIDDRNENILAYVISSSNHEILIPLNDDLIIDIDHKACIIKMDLPEELLVLNINE